MSEFEAPRHGLASLRPWQRQFVEHFLSSEQGHVVLAAPLGMGKAKTAGEIATAVATRPARVLVVAPIAVGRSIAASAKNAGLPTLELTKATLRQLSSEAGAWVPDAAVVYASPQVVADPWVVELLSEPSWALVIADHPAARENSALAAVIERSGARALVLSEQTERQSLVWPPGDGEVYALGSELLAGENTPGPELAARFEPVVWERDERETRIIGMVEELLALASPYAQTLGLRRLRAAAASSNYALQAVTLALLDRIREERNIAVHLGSRWRQERLLDFDGEEEWPLIEIVSRLDALAAAIDELESDSKQDAFMGLALDPSPLDRQVGCVVFCALSATADYVASGLRFMQQPVVRLSSSRPGQDEVEWALQQPEYIVVVHDGTLQGVDLSAARQAVNYDLVSNPRRMHIRWSRLDWTESDQLRIWTLVPGTTASPVEQEALERMPYLMGGRPEGKLTR